MSLRSLQELRAEIDKIITEIEGLPERRDIDIASDFNGDSALVAEVKRIGGDKKKEVWRQLRKIYCSTEHCPTVRMDGTGIHTDQIRRPGK